MILAGRAQGADIAATKHGLIEAGLDLEEFGGDIQVREISALKGIGIKELEEALSTAAELGDLRGDRAGLAEGSVLEVKLVKGLGPVATVLVQRGTLRTGAVLVAGTAQCRVRQVCGAWASPVAPGIISFGPRNCGVLGSRCFANARRNARATAIGSYTDSLGELYKCAVLAGSVSRYGVHLNVCCCGLMALP